MTTPPAAAAPQPRPQAAHSALREARQDCDEWHIREGM